MAYSLFLYFQRFSSILMGASATPAEGTMSDARCGVQGVSSATLPQPGFGSRRRLALLVMEGWAVIQEPSAESHRPECPAGRIAWLFAGAKGIYQQLPVEQHFAALEAEQRTPTLLDRRFLGDRSRLVEGGDGYLACRAQPRSDVGDQLLVPASRDSSSNSALEFLTGGAGRELLRPGSDQEILRHITEWQARPYVSFNIPVLLDLATCEFQLPITQDLNERRSRPETHRSAPPLPMNEVAAMGGSVEFSEDSLWAETACTHLLDLKD